MNTYHCGCEILEFTNTIFPCQKHKQQIITIINTTGSNSSRTKNTRKI